MIDHSLLHPTLTDKDIITGCELSKRYDVATACVKPYSIELARDVLAGSAVKVCPVIAFPHGNSATPIKVKEAEDAALRGGAEIDMVVNTGKVLGGDWDYVSKEIKLINEVVVGNKGTLKVIFENDYLEDSHIIQLCEICSHHEVAFVKTSTGYGFVKQANGMYSYKGAIIATLISLVVLLQQACTHLPGQDRDFFPVYGDVKPVFLPLLSFLILGDQLASRQKVFFPLA